MSRDLQTNDKGILSFRPTIEYIEPPPEPGEINPIIHDVVPLEQVMLNNLNLRNYADAIDKLAEAIQAKADKRAQGLRIILDRNVDAPTIQAMQRRFPGADPTFITYDQYRAAKDDLRELGRAIGDRAAITPDKVADEQHNAVQSLLDSTKTRSGQISSDIASQVIPQSSSITPTNLTAGGLSGTGGGTGVGNIAGVGGAGDAGNVNKSKFGQGIDVNTILNPPSQSIGPDTAVDDNIGSLGEETGLPGIVGIGPIGSGSDLLTGLTAKELAAIGILGGTGGLSGGQNIGSDTNPLSIDNPESSGAQADDEDDFTGEDGAFEIDPVTGRPKKTLVRRKKKKLNKSQPRQNIKVKPRMGGFNDPGAAQGSLRPELNEDIQIIAPLNIPEIEINLLCILVNALWKIFILNKLKHIPVIGSKLPKKLCDPGFDFDIPGLFILGDPPDFPVPPKIPKNLAGS